MTDLVTISTSSGIADVRLNRPDKYNALSREMFQAIIEAGQTLAEAKDVRVVVLSGNGRGFCAGLDMASFQGMAETEQDRAGGTASLMSRGDGPENHARHAESGGSHRGQLRKTATEVSGLSTMP